MSTLRRVLRTVTETIDFLSALMSVLEIFLGILSTKDRLHVMYFLLLDSSQRGPDHSREGLVEDARI